MTFTANHLVFVCCSLISPALAAISDNTCNYRLNEMINNFEECLTTNNSQHEMIFNCSAGNLRGLPSWATIHTGFQILDFSNNKIGCLPMQNYSDPQCHKIKKCNGCLRELRLQGNAITFVDDRAFNHLVCLQVLNLANNNITRAKLPMNLFAQLQSLRHLDLHGNPLGSLPDSILTVAGMPKLQILNLSSCQLSSVGAASLDDFSDLTVLDLSNNSLTNLSSQTFKGLKSLRLLDLSRNRLNVIEDETFDDLQNLEVLRLNDNFLHSLTPFFQSTLSVLFLQANRFTDIPYMSLQSLKQLKMLDLSANPVNELQSSGIVTKIEELKLDFLPNLTSVKEGAFTAFQNLRTLSLRYCPNLKAIAHGAFHGNFSILQAVYLDHDALETLSKELLPWQQLSHLTLNDNPWHCNCELGWASGHQFANTTFVCQTPLVLKAKTLDLLQPDKLPCPRSLTGIITLIVLYLNLVIVLVIVVFVWQQRRKLPCTSLRGLEGQYVSVFSKDIADTSIDMTEENIRDLELRKENEQSDGRVQILLRSFLPGHKYSRLQEHDTESTRDLTQNTHID